MSASLDRAGADGVETAPNEPGAERRLELAWDAEREGIVIVPAPGEQAQRRAACWKPAGPVWMEIDEPTLMMVSAGDFLSHRNLGALEPRVVGQARLRDDELRVIGSEHLRSTHLQVTIRVSEDIGQAEEELSDLGRLHFVVPEAAASDRGDAKKQHPIRRVLHATMERAWHPGKPSALIGYSPGDLESGLDESWWAEVLVSRAHMQALIEAIRAGRCRKLTMGARFVGLLDCDDSPFPSWRQKLYLLPSQVNFGEDRATRWLCAKDGRVEVVLGRTFDLKWTESSAAVPPAAQHDDADADDEEPDGTRALPAIAPSTPTATPADLRAQLRPLVKALRSVFWALVAIALVLALRT